MIKNNGQAAPKAEQTVLVADEFGNKRGSTYPKRARGLVKNGRAFWMNDSEIRLNCPPELTEDTRMENFNIDTTEPNAAQTTDNTAANSYTPAEPIVLNFNAREFRFNPDCDKNRGNRTFISTPFDTKLVEAWQIGNWRWEWTEIRTKELTLKKNTKHLFRFWLNGGENDQNDEVCQFKVIFNGDTNDELTYMLNRNYIKPVKKSCGWLLFELPFMTEDNEYTTLKFVAMRAPMAIMPVYQDAEALSKLDETDINEGKVQHSNLVFSNGWDNKNYDYANRSDSGNTYQNTAPVFNFNGEFPKDFDFSNMEGFAERIREQVLNEIDLDEIAEEIASNMDIDGIAEQIKNSIYDNFKK
ncbi:MAG: hypothetical protein QM689_00195 [Oscillospiraceae bacterium]